VDLFLDLRIVAIDLVILRRMPPEHVLQAIERALDSERFGVGLQHRVQFARQHRKRRVLGQFIVIVQVPPVQALPARGQAFIPQCQAEDALST
jgi:hypothetical protein